MGQGYFVHPSSVIDDPCEIGEGTRIWHFCHVMPHARIGRKCVLGQNVFVGRGVTIGDNVKLQNNVSVYEGVTLEDGVFCGPSCVFTNDLNPRSEFPKHGNYVKTLVRRGVSIGANATIVCGTTIGRYAFIGAGAVVVHDVPEFALVVGNPARLVGWRCMCGEKLAFRDQGDAAVVASCRACSRDYRKQGIAVQEVE
ncbi:MAG: N-acetyltransferase [Chloroflexi bacterium]|nr:N-acetyltransferase [Chloroflexota bacterium]